MLHFITTKPGSRHGPSIKNPRVYDALRRQGMSKSQAAAISNAQFRKRKKALPVVLKAPNYGARAGQTIGGRLMRGADGKFSGGGTAAPAKPKRKPKKTEAERAAERQQRASARQTERQQERIAQRDQILADFGIDPGASEAIVMLAGGEQPEPGAIARAGFVEAGLVEQAKDGSYRMTPAGRQLINAAMRGDKGAAGDIISRSRDQMAKRTEAEKPPKAAAGGGGGGKKKPEKPPKLPARQSSQAAKPVGGGGGGSAARQQPERETEPTTDPELAALAQRLSAGETISADEQQTLIRNGLARLVKGELVLTQAGSRATRGKATGSPGDYLVVEDRDKPSTWHLQVKRSGTPDHRLMGAAWAALHGGYRGNKYAGPQKNEALAKLRALYKREGMDVPSEKETTHEPRLVTGTGRAPAQGSGISAALRKGLRTRHDGSQPANADRQAVRPARQVTAEPKRIKAIAPTRVTDAGHTGVMVAFYPDQAAANAIATADGVTEPTEALHLTLCFLGDSTEQPLATNKDRLIEAIAQWATEQGQPLKGVVNGLGRFFHSESDDTNAVYVSPDVPGLPELRQGLAEWIEASGFDYSQDHGFTPHITVAYVPLDAPTPPIRVETPIQFDRATLAWGDEQYDFPLGMTAKAFQVFKDASGRHRWVAYSSNAYRDRDEEIVSTKALTEDCARADADGQYGPLRWWHVPGWELGQADFNAMHGRVLVESGTFKSAAIGQAVAAAAPNLQLSIGFTHAPDEPDRHGVFHHIRRFERSLVPSGRAANPFTRLIVKEHLMDNEKEAALKATLGSDAAAQILAGAEAVQKDADDKRTAYKSDSDPWAAVTQALKAAVVDMLTPPAPVEGPPAEPVTEKAPPPVAADAVMEEEEVVVEEQAMEPMDDGGGEMTADEFLAQIGALIDAKLAPIAGLLDIEKKVAGHVASLMQPFQAQKDASDAERQQEIATLKATIAEQQQRLAALEGDVPQAFHDPFVAGFRASQSDATVATKEQIDGLELPALSSDAEWDKIYKGLVGTNGHPS